MYIPSRKQLAPENRPKPKRETHFSGCLLLVLGRVPTAPNHVMIYPKNKDGTSHFPTFNSVISSFKMLHTTPEHWRLEAQNHPIEIRISSFSKPSWLCCCPVNLKRGVIFKGFWTFFQQRDLGSQAIPRPWSVLEHHHPLDLVVCT